jgi:hypothetical protein
MRSWAILALALAGLSGQPLKTASKQAEELEQRAQAAATAGDHKARIAADLDLFHLLNGSPIVVEALARAYASSGDPQGALAELNKFADLGQTDETLLGGRDKRYSSIQTLPGYTKVMARLSANQKPISLSSPAIVLPDADLLPEDIDYDTNTRAFLVTSILKRKIIRVQTDGSVTDLLFRRTAGPWWPSRSTTCDAKFGQRKWHSMVLP